MHVIHSETVGSVKVCCVFEKLSDETRQKFRDSGIDVSPVPVQKLFIYLTENGREFQHE